MALRLQAMGQANYTNGFELTLHERMLDLSLRWKKPQMIFVNSMSDLFHTAHLRQTAVQIKFLSLEPLLGPLPEL